MSAIPIFIAHVLDVNYLTEYKEAVFYRIPIDLFTPEVQKNIYSSENFKINITHAVLDTASRKAYAEKVKATVRDLFRDKSGQISSDIGRMEFLARNHITPARFLKLLEDKLLTKPVNFTASGESSFQSKSSSDPDTLMMSPKEVGMMPDNPADFKKSCFLKNKIDVIRSEFQNSLVAFLDKKPIMPEEQIFTSFRAIAFKRMVKTPESSELKDFFLFIDLLEFKLRDYCYLKEHDLEALKSISQLIRENSVVASPKEVFQKAFKVLLPCAQIIDLIEKENCEENLELIKNFLIEVVYHPLKDHLNCSVSLTLAKDTARENLTLRVSQILLQSQYLYPPGGGPHVEEAVDKLQRIRQFFQAGDWVSANDQLCQILTGSFFKMAANHPSDSFGNSEKFAHNKLAASIISLISFFTDVVSSSSEYRWINFSALTACLTYFNPMPLTKRDITSLKNWAAEFREKEMSILPNLFLSFFQTLKSLADIDLQFKEKHGESFKLWLLSAKNGTMNGLEYVTLCQKISETIDQINGKVKTLSNAVHKIQAEIILFSGKKNAPKIEPPVLKEQLEHLNGKITEICLPLLTFLHNFYHLMVNGEGTSPVDTFALFETDPGKLFVMAEEKEEEELTVEWEEENPAGQPSAPKTLQSDLKELFQEKNRRKLLVSLCDFFKARDQMIEIVSGKGSHIKMYLKGRPIIIPNSRELKVGIAGSIQKDILERLKQMV